MFLSSSLSSFFFLSLLSSPSFFNKPSGTGKHSLCVFDFGSFVFFFSSFSFRRSSTISNSRCFLAKVSSFLASFAFFLSKRSRAILALSVSTRTTSSFVASYAVFLFSLYSALHFSVSSVLLFTASSSQSLFRNVNEILPSSARTGNIACSYTSPLSPSKIIAEFFSHTTRHSSPSSAFVMSYQLSSGNTALLLLLLLLPLPLLLLSSKPGCQTIPLPKMHISSANKLTVQKGLLKFGLSTCGGNHWPLRYTFTVQLSGIKRRREVSFAPPPTPPPPDERFFLASSSFFSSPNTPRSTSLSTTSSRKISGIGSTSTSWSVYTRFECVYVPYCSISLPCKRLSHFGGIGVYVAFFSSFPERPSASCEWINWTSTSWVSASSTFGMYLRPGTDGKNVSVASSFEPSSSRPISLDRVLVFVFFRARLLRSAREKE